MSFTATSVGIEENEDDEFLDVWLSEAPGGTGNSLSFQRSLLTADQDAVDMGIDSYCISSHHGVSVYGPLREVRLDGNALELTFTAEDAHILGLSERTRIDLAVTDAAVELLTAGLRSVLVWGRPQSIPVIVGF